MESCCRICRKTAPFESVWLNSWSKSIKELISDMYTYCTQLEVSDSDLLPQKICEDCLNKLTAAYDFRRLCRHSDAFFQEKLRIMKSTNQQSVRATPDRAKPERRRTIVRLNVKTPEQSQNADDSLELTVGPTFDCCCEQCSETTKDRDKLIAHAVEKHQLERTENERNRQANREFICYICLRGFSSKTQLNVHQGSIEGIEKLFCTRCGESFCSDVEFANHEVLGCPTKETEADVNVPAVWNSLVQKILAVENTEELLRLSPEEQTIVKRKKFITRLRSKIKHSKRQAKLYFVCETCNFRAASAKDVKLHLRAETCGKAYYLALGFCHVTLRKVQCLECADCGHQSVYSKNLRRHQESYNHHGIRRAVKIRKTIGSNLPCEYCGRLLATTASRKSHRIRCLMAFNRNTTQTLQEEPSVNITASADIDAEDQSSNTCDGNEEEPFVTDIKIEEFDPEDIADQEMASEKPKLEQNSPPSDTQREPPKTGKNKPYYYCAICSYTTAKRSNLKRHTTACLEKVPPQQSAYYSEKVKQEFAKNFRKLPPRVCESCGYWTNKSGNMKRHIVRCQPKVQRPQSIETDSLLTSCEGE